MENNNVEKNVLHSFYSSKAFVKIKQCLSIGKMLFSFVSKENSKEQHIDCYLEAEEFGALLMARIRSGQLFKDLLAEKAKGEKYPKAVWTSPMGGNATGNNGKPISRYFTISPGSTADVVFTAFVYPATQNETGAFIAVKGEKPLLRLIVSCSYDDLRLMLYKWSFLEQDYMASKWCLANMQNDFTGKQEEPETKPQTSKNQSGTSQPAETNTGNSPVSTNANKGTSDNETLVTIEVSTLSLLQEYGKLGNLCFKAADKKNNNYNMIIEPKIIATFDSEKWQNFKEKAEKAKGIHLVTTYAKYGDKCFIRKIS